MRIAPIFMLCYITLTHYVIMLHRTAIQKKKEAKKTYERKIMLSDTQSTRKIKLHFYTFLYIV